MSKTIYAESTEHLEEVLHKSNNMLSMIVKKNISYLHLWNGFLSSDPDDASTQAYLESAQQQLGFAEFYFLSYDGNYMTPGGETGYLGLQTNLDELLSDQKDVVLNTALPGQDPMLVFICPETKGIYRALPTIRCHQPLQQCCDEDRGRFVFRRSGQLLCHLPDGRS